MAIKLPRLPRAVAIVGKDGWPAQMFQQWWQSVAVALEGAILTLQGAVQNITDILVRLGLVEITADGALELAEGTINPDGTIKSGKVVTESIIPNGVTERYLATLATNITLPDGVETDIVVASVTKIEDESDVDLDVSARLQSSDDLRGEIRIYRDATLITSFDVYLDSPGRTLRDIITMLHTDFGVPAGVYTYRAAFARDGGANAVEAAAGSLIRAKEYKR